MVAATLDEQTASRFAQTTKARINYNEAGSGRPNRHAALIANSLGDAAGLTFGVRHPDRVSHIVAMGSAPVRSQHRSVFSPAGLSEGFRVLRETYEDPPPENFGRLVQVMVYDASFATDELMQQRSRGGAAIPCCQMPAWRVQPLWSLGTVRARRNVRLAVDGFLKHER